MSWNFILLIFINVCQVRRTSLYSWINYNHSDGELLYGRSYTLKTRLQGLARTRIALCQRPGADTEETGRYDLAWKDLCSVLNASQ